MTKPPSGVLEGGLLCLSVERLLLCVDQNAAASQSRTSIGVFCLPDNVVVHDGSTDCPDLDAELVNATTACGLTILGGEQESVIAGSVE